MQNLVAKNVHFTCILSIMCAKIYATGMVFVMPLVDTYQKIDMRMKAFNVPPQQVSTY